MYKNKLAEATAAAAPNPLVGEHVVSAAARLLPGSAVLMDDDFATEFAASRPVMLPWKGGIVEHADSLAQMRQLRLTVAPLVQWELANFSSQPVKVLSQPFEIGG